MRRPDSPHANRRRRANEIFCMPGVWPLHASGTPPHSRTRVQVAPEPEGDLEEAVGMSITARRAIIIVGTILIVGAILATLAFRL